MSNKTKTSFGAVVTVIIAFVVGVVALTQIDKENNEEKVSLRVEFPQTGRAQVTKDGDTRVVILVDVNGVIVFEDRARFSPWTKTMAITKGAKLILTAESILPGPIGCSINGVVNRSNSKRVGCIRQ